MRKGVGGQAQKGHQDGFLTGVIVGEWLNTHECVTRRAGGGRG